MKDLMIDCETMATGTHPLILSIGAVVFNPTDAPELPELIPEWRCFYRTLKHDNQELDYGRKIDPSTVDWWARQDDDVLDMVLHDPNAVDFRDALTDLDAFVRKNAVERVWSYGATADIIWLETAFKAIGRDFPFSYRNLRCMRTVVALSGAAEPPRYGRKHHSLDDALSQVRWLQTCMDQRVAA